MVVRCSEEEAGFAGTGGGVLCADEVLGWSGRERIDGGGVSEDQAAMDADGVVWDCAVDRGLRS